VLALRTGCRREGLCELLHQDVEPGAAAVTVVIKGGRRHKIHLDDEARNALAAWLGWLAARKITDGAVFRSLRRGIRNWIVGERLHQSSINLIFQHRADLACVGKFFPHLARHAFVSWADAAGVPRRRIAAVTGHLDLGSLSSYLADVEAETDPVGGHLPSLTAP
jgi:integrase